LFKRLKVGEPDAVARVLVVDLKTRREEKNQFVSDRGAVESVQKYFEKLEKNACQRGFLL
jgi:hypothetical protein